MTDPYAKVAADPQGANVKPLKGMEGIYRARVENMPYRVLFTARTAM